MKFSKYRGYIELSLNIGDKITFERTFTERDVELFTEVSCDEGVHQERLYKG